MNPEKKLNISLISILIVSIIIISLLSAFLVFQKNLILQKVQASPGPDCDVNDNLNVTGNVTVGGTLYTGCITVYGGCLDGGESVSCSTNAQTCACNNTLDSARVYCPTGKVVVGGGCDSSGDARISDSWPASADSWFCDWGGAVTYERAWAICCDINMDRD